MFQKGFIYFIQPFISPSAVVEAAEGRLHNGGWGNKWLDKVDETFLKHFAIVSDTFHPLYLAIYRCPDVRRATCRAGMQGHT